MGQVWYFAYLSYMKYILETALFYDHFACVSGDNLNCIS